MIILRGLYHLSSLSLHVKCVILKEKQYLRTLKMGMVKEILGQTMVEVLCCNISVWSSLPNRFWIKRHTTVSMLPNFSELKTMLQLPLSHSSKRDLASNPFNVTFTIAGTATIKNSKEMMLPSMHQQRGIVFQLVSTEIHPSKPYILTINNALAPRIS